ncbi:hypothetical protein FRC12_014336 [Ceratobasidium sp. 428]|nr:hypothetical protein FRC12_014336 [Ceratobasidium sp. 428]
MPSADPTPLVVLQAVASNTLQDFVTRAVSLGVSSPSGTSSPYLARPTKLRRTGGFRDSPNANVNLASQGRNVPRLSFSHRSPKFLPDSPHKGPAAGRSQPPTNNGGDELAFQSQVQRSTPL